MYRGNIGIMDKRMETIIMGYIGTLGICLKLAWSIVPHSLVHLISRVLIILPVSSNLRILASASCLGLIL